jgi:short-chain fatty acids transporter
VIGRAAEAFARFAQRALPSPFAFALLLTIVAFVAGLFVGRPDGQSLAARTADLVAMWYGGDLLAAATGRARSIGGFVSTGGFALALQMCLILATGYALAAAPPIARALRRLAGLPRREPVAAATVALVAMLSAWLNWGFGLVVGAVFAREVYRSARDRGERWNYPLLGAAGYIGLMVWHGGLSGSAPLAVAQPGHDHAAIFGVVPTSRTLFSPLNIGLNAALLLLVPPLFAGLARAAASGRERALAAGRPRDEAEPVWRLPDERHDSPSSAAERARPGSRAEQDGAEARFDHSRLLAGLVVALAGGALARLVHARGWSGSLSLPSVSVAFLAAAIALHGSIGRFGRAFTEAGGELSGILLQFPFYYGILGLVAESGVGEALANSSLAATRGLVALGLPVETAFSWITFATAAVLNMFVPSGGGQWAIQGGIAASGALALGLDPARAVLLVAYGDEATNMVQPFWAITLLSITGLRAGEILSWSALAMGAAMPIFLVALAAL